MKWSHNSKAAPALGTKWTVCRWFAMVAGLLLAGSALAQQATTSTTSWQGGGKGAKQDDLTCAADQLLVGVRIRYGNGDGDVVDGMQARCAKHENGGWSGNASTASGTANTNNPSPATTWLNVDCPEDRFVTGFQVHGTIKSGFLVISGVNLQCTRFNAQFQAQNHQSTGFKGANNSSAIPLPPIPAACAAAQPVAYGVSTVSGWYVDRMRLNCRSAPAAPAPTAAPTVEFPRWVGAAAGNHAATPGWQVTSTQVPGATQYQVCLRRLTSQQCYFNQYRSHGALNVDIPASEQGTISEVLVRGCNAQTQCGPWSAEEKMTVVPNHAPLVSPANNAQLSSRNVTFSWQANSAAQAGYQLLIYKSPGPHGYSVYNANAPSIPGQLMVVPVASGTQTTVNVDPALGDQVAWGVLGCQNFPEKGRRCSLGWVPHQLQFAGTRDQPPSRRGGGGTYTWTTQPITSQDVFTYNLPAEATNQRLADGVHGQYRLRADMTCIACHSGARNATQPNLSNVSRQQFCNMVDGFNNSSIKPQNLKNLFKGWKDRGCPE